MKKIGVLLPQSMAFPRMATDYIDGLKLSIGENTEIKVEGIGLGNDHKVVIDAVQKLIYQEDVDLLTGILGHVNLNQILDFIEQMEVPFIYANMGAKQPVDLSKRKNIICNSLDLFGATLVLGEHFTKLGLKSIGMSTCYYDVGYDFTLAMESSIRENSNLKFAGHFITPHVPRENEADLMKEFFEEIKPDVIFGFHNGIFAKEHANYLNSSGYSKNTPLYLSPFSVDQSVLSENSESFNGIFCTSPWFPELETEGNKNFVKSFRNEYDKNPNFFSLLGYENALLIRDMVTLDLDGEPIQIDGPRGMISSNLETNSTNFNHYIWQLHATENGYTKSVVASFAPQETPNVESFDSEGNGWQNAYLCH